MFYLQILRIFLSHTIYLVASAAATYSASVVESARTDCLHDLQETAPDPGLIAYPEVDTPVSLSPLKSESEYPIKAEVVHLCILDSKVLSSLQVP